ncbi:hypothetical protein LTR85_002726 [Meristemomyces frigidus]|nr:hypothetical protein LTR85_002726 [Meristemomyces frigidus]
MNQGAQPLAPQGNRPVRTFYFIHIQNQPNDDYTLSITLGFLVRAGLMVQHNATMVHHGDSIINAAYALFDIRLVDGTIQDEQDATTGAVNGSGGMGGAVTCFVRGADNISRMPGQTAAVAELTRLAKHIFGNREVARAEAEI